MSDSSDHNALRRELANSDLNVSLWGTELANDFDKDYLLNEIFYGFDIIEPISLLKKVFVQNHRSALEPGVKDVMDGIIRGELA